MNEKANDDAVTASGTRPTVCRVWLRLSTAAELVDLTPAALRKRLARHPLRKGILKRWGGSIFVHQERFLRWLDAG